jgi:A/G-specific adenine glycosylase
LNPTVVRAERNDRLAKWFRFNGRDLPWRRTVDPYPVLVSEVMLQQTQIGRVVPIFEAFMDLWPDIESLASADMNVLMRAWSGLGYNSRALRLREASRLVAADGWPNSINGLMGLPGVGPYTAAAIGSISFGEDVPAVDTNLRRVLSRWAGEPLEGSTLDAYALKVVSSPAGDWNQALMDLGAAVCTPKQPKCTICPVSEWCVDPAIYVPPPRQSRFEGSHRQLRGALLRAHLAGRDLLETGRELRRPDTEIQGAVSALKREGLIGPDD